jgi:hypothetical protein
VCCVVGDGRNGGVGGEGRGFAMLIVVACCNYGGRVDSVASRVFLECRQICLDGVVWV